MNRLENLNKKFKKEINEVTEKPGGRYPQKLIDSILKFMIDDIMTDGKHGFSPVEISNVTGINVSVLYRWRKGNSSKKVTKKTTKKASKKVSKKTSKKTSKKEAYKKSHKKEFELKKMKKEEREVSGFFKNRPTPEVLDKEALIANHKEFKLAIFNKIHHSDMIPQLNEILDESVHNFEELEEFEITEIKRIITWASLLFEGIEELTSDITELNDFIIGNKPKKESK